MTIMIYSNSNSVRIFSIKLFTFTLQVQKLLKDEYYLKMRFVDYNVFIEQFPNSIWAGIAGYTPKTEYYAADAASKTAPKVDFSK